MGGPASSTTAEIYIQAHEQNAVSTPPHPQKAWGRFADEVYSILKHTHLESFFHQSTIFMKTLSLLWRKKVMKN